MKQDDMRRKWELAVKKTKEKQGVDPNSWKPRTTGPLTKEMLARFTAQMIKSGSGNP